MMCQRQRPGSECGQENSAQMTAETEEMEGFEYMTLEVGGTGMVAESEKWGNRGLKGHSLTWRLECQHHASQTHRLQTGEESQPQTAHGKA